jgi:threonine dehydrogenase-like Zn-dependent dehydrogenase
LRAAIYQGPGLPLVVQDIEAPRPAADEVLVRIHRCGVCGSDLSQTDGKAGAGAFPPGRVGHEYCGEVVEVGRDVSSHRPGMRVTAPAVAGCGDCEGCRLGHDNFCRRLRMTFGGFGEYVAIPARAAVPVPEGLSSPDGAFIEPIACGLHALRMAQVGKGDRLLLLGAGSMAVAMTWWGRRLGVGRIVAAARSPNRAEALLALGADAVLPFDAEPGAFAAVLGGAPDIVAECVGKPGMLERAAALVRQGGTVLSLGMCWHGEPVTPGRWTRKELRLLFPQAYSLRELEETGRAFDADGFRPADLLVSEVITLEALPTTLEAMRAGGVGGKVQVDPWLAAP